MRAKGRIVYATLKLPRQHPEMFSDFSSGPFFIFYLFLVVDEDGSHQGKKEEETSLVS
jgi:hypothetical protein